MPDPVEKTAEQLALEVKAEFDKTMNQVKEIAEKALAEAAKGVGMTDDLKEKADEFSPENERPDRAGRRH